MKKNYRKLVKNTAGMPNIKTYNMGAWSHRDTPLFSSCSGRNSHLSHQGTEVQVTDLDSLTRERLTLIKMDVEGSELKALEGAEKIITAYRPKLYVCAYHRNDDLFTLPLKIWEMCPDYKIYFCHTPYIPAWESNFYCVI